MSDRHFDALEELFRSVEEEIGPSQMGDKTHSAMSRAKEALDEGSDDDPENLAL